MFSGTKISPSANPLRPLSGLALFLLLGAGLLTAGCRGLPASGADAASKPASRYAAASPKAMTEAPSHGCDQGLFAATAWECLRNGTTAVGQDGKQ